MNPKARMFIALFIPALLTLACRPSEQDRMVPIGPEVRASLVIYFKTGVTDQQIEDFWNNVLSRPDPQGRGHYHRDGVGDISRVFPPVQSHEGIALSFFPDATASEREAIKRDVTLSPIVYKVLENVSPTDVKKLD